MNNPDYFSILLANQILGGGGDSKLFMNLREKHGFTYGSYSNVGKGRFQTTFRASAAVRSEKADSAVVEMINEINNLREGKITPEELNTAKAVYNGSFALDMEDPSVAATYATNILINGLPKDFYKKFMQKVNSVTTSDIQKAAEKYFTVDKGRIIIVGNGSKILPNLARLGYPVKKFDKFANPIIDKESDVNIKETAKTTESVSAFSIIENYLAAIGGKEELKKINSLKSEVSMEAMGREFTGVDKKLAPNKQFIEMKMGDMVVFNTVFDGKKGYRSQMGQKKEFDAEEIKEYDDIKGPVSHLYFNSADFKTDYLGTGKVGEEDAYKLKVTKPSGNISIEYYSIKTGLLLREENTVKQKDMEVSEIVDYSDYKKVGNVLFPFTINRTVGEQDINMKITDIKINEGVTEADFQQ
ncbi:MAG: insulinase family protein [Chitinophagaceae bacterium]|nr:insulinase family protein [Chitinophagaceae bacterium]